MRRELEYTISDEEDDDAATYVHKLSQTDGDDVREAFCLAGIPYSPGELAELHKAIHEMLRMGEQHRGALTDGATPAAAALTADEADLVSVADIKLLGMLSEGVTLKMGHPALSRFRNRGWVDVTDATDGWPTSEREYGITNAGRARLAAQTPEVEREPALDSDQRWILSHMTDGSMLVWDPTVGDGQTVTIENGHSTLTKHELALLYRDGYIAFAVCRSGGAGPKRYYAIADKGRARLAAQTPVPESEKPLSGTALDILRGMAGGRRLLDAIESAFVMYEASGTSFSREPFVELRKRGLVCVAQDAGDGFRYYAISAEGVDFLADQGPS